MDFICGDGRAYKNGLDVFVLGMQSGTPRHTRIFDKMNIINVITNTYSCSIKAVDTRYGN